MPASGNTISRKRQATTPAAAKCIPVLKQYPTGVINQISPRDAMYDEPESYFANARQALDCVRLAALAAKKSKVWDLLDLPCGHGRILRMLKAEYPDARLTCCDIDHDGVDFCAKLFGARPLYGEARPADVQLDGQTFDLIWCGSLLTHLDVPAWREFVDFFETALIPGGLLVVTSHGRGWAEILKNAETGRGQLPDDDMRKAILRRYEDTGFGYADYDLPDDDRLSLSLPRNYGTSLAKPSWVCQFFESRARLRLVTYMENRWGGQDVLAFIRLWNS